MILSSARLQYGQSRLTGLFDDGSRPEVSEGVSKVHGKHSTPLPQADASRTAGRTAEALITPPLFSHRPPPNREKREQSAFVGLPAPLSPGRRGGGWERGAVQSEGL